MSTVSTSPLLAADSAAVLAAGLVVSLLPRRDAPAPADDGGPIPLHPIA